MTKLDNSKKSPSSNPDLHIKICENGPYLLYGSVPMAQQFITPDKMNESWSYRRGKEYPTDRPTALCRCGASKQKPYCDGSHLTTDWDDTLTASREGLLDEAKLYHGEGLDLSDNENYCCYARFCHPAGGAWRLAKESDDEESRRLAIREASMCPSARLSAWEFGADDPYEFDFEESIGLLEDPAMDCSAGIWLRGGIRLEHPDGTDYEVRNRVVLCRCGESRNKPYCDGAHAATKWRDETPQQPSEEEMPDGELEIKMG